jgi:uncharacterized membrane-anchored protein
MRPTFERPTITLPDRGAIAKVPQITALFWVIKVLTTGMGEAASDYLGSVNLAVAGLVGVAGFAVAIWWQLRTRRYSAPVYWFAVAMVAVFGTMAADIVHVVLGIPYAVSTAGYAIALAVVFVWWYRSEGTLSIHSITTRRRENFYWLTVLLTFALGTAAGDLTATEMHLGFFSSAVLFAVLMVIPLLGLVLRVNPIATFWTAYVLTRPLGASVADWLGKPHDIGGGVGFGDGTVTAISLAAIVALVAWVTLTGADTQHELSAPTS